MPDTSPGIKLLSNKEWPLLDDAIPFSLPSFRGPFKGSTPRVLSSVHLQLYNLIQDCGWVLFFCISTTIHWLTWNFYLELSSLPGPPGGPPKRMRNLLELWREQAQGPEKILEQGHMSTRDQGPPMPAWRNRAGNDPGQLAMPLPMEQTSWTGKKATLYPILWSSGQGADSHTFLSSGQAHSEHTAHFGEGDLGSCWNGTGL